MSHPNPSHDRSNEYPSDNYKPVSKRFKGKKKSHKHTAISAMIDSLKERKGEAPLAKLKRLVK